MAAARLVPEVVGHVLLGQVHARCRWWIRDSRGECRRGRGGAGSCGRGGERRRAAASQGKPLSSCRRRGTRGGPGLALALA
jgi:hypothetical protein